MSLSLDVRHRFSVVGALLVGLLSLGQAIPAAARLPPPPGHEPTDEVRLRSGGLVRGDVREVVPGQYVLLIEARGGASTRFEWSEVEAVVRADGTVIGREAADALPTPKPEPFPEVEPEAKTDPKPQPESGPESDPEPPVEGPSAQIALNVNRDGPLVSLHYSEGSESLCEAPCEREISSAAGMFVVESEGERLGKPFELPGGASHYRIDVTRKSPAKRWTGVVLIPATLLIGVGIGLIPVFNNMPQSQAPGYFIGGAAIGVVGVAGGVTLIRFSRSKVKVLPGSAATSTRAPSSM